MNNKYTYLFLPVIIIIACFIIWPPSQLMITDELSYFFQAKNWIGGNINNTIIDAVSGTTHTLIEGHYPPGNSFILGGFYSINESLIYFAGLIFYLASIFLSYQTLKENNLPIIGLCVLYLFIPLIFIARTTMSEMPSLLLITIGVYLYFRNKSSSYLWLAFITGLSLSFRETNLLLIAPLAFFISKNYIYSALAFLAGLSFRLLGYYILKTNPFFVKEGYPFGLEYLPDTIFIYAVILLVLLPLSPLWFSRVPRENIKPFSIGLLSFLGLHLVYGYVAHVYSGYTNGLLLNGRFWIPALPIFVIAMSYYLKDRNWINNKWIGAAILGIILIVNVGVHYKISIKQNEFYQFSEELKSVTQDQLTFIDMNSRTPIYRYIYSFVQDRKWSDINLVNDSFHIHQAFEKNGSFNVAIITSGATVAQSSRNDQFYKIIDKLKENYSVKNIIEFCPGSNSCLNMYEVREQ